MTSNRVSRKELNVAVISNIKWTAKCQFLISLISLLTDIASMLKVGRSSEFFVGSDACICGEGKRVGNPMHSRGDA